MSVIQNSHNSPFDRFDYIACICFTGYLERQKSIVEEFKRIGILERVNFFWDFPSPYITKLSSIVCKSRYHQKMFPIGYNNYRAIKTSFELGYNSILVMEDDIRFLKDVTWIGKAIRELPYDYEIAMLDKNFPTREFTEYICTHKRIEETRNIEWKNFSCFHSSGCYSLSRRGMEKFIRAYEFDGDRRRMKNNDEYFNCKVFDYKKMYAAFPNIAIQGIIGCSGSSSPMDEYWRINEFQGGKQSMYNLPCPYITKQNFIPELYQALDRGIQNNGVEVLSRVNNIFCAFPEELSKGIRSDSVKNRLNDNIKGFKYGASMVWGHGTHNANINALQIAFRDDCPVILCEDGFIRSGTTWVDKTLPSRFRYGHSLIYDSSAYYFDATRVSTIEKMLNDRNLIVTQSQIAEAKRIIEKIVSSKVSKYNHQPIYKPKIGREGAKKILVVDQSYGDFSIAKGMANEETFINMLTTAIKENPDADILVKTHPDTIAGKKSGKKGYYQDLIERGNIYKVTFPINPYSLMDICDKVYVCTSGMGLEALLAGKEVHTFGMPFYAGWGLTIDAQHLDRRTNKRTLEELVYIFYFLYTHWVDPESGTETTIDKVIDKMIAMRDISYRFHNSQAQHKIENNNTISRIPIVREPNYHILSSPMRRRPRLA